MPLSLFIVEALRRTDEAEAQFVVAEDRTLAAEDRASAGEDVASANEGRATAAVAHRR